MLKIVTVSLVLFLGACNAFQTPNKDIFAAEQAITGLYRLTAEGVKADIIAPDTAGRILLGIDAARTTLTQARLLYNQHNPKWPEYLARTTAAILIIQSEIANAGSRANPTDKSSLGDGNGYRLYIVEISGSRYSNRGICGAVRRRNCAPRDRKSVV